MKDHKNITYFAYCRKSSEDSKRQVASIGDQTDAVNKIVRQDNLDLKRAPFTEEQSAKDPGRKVFNEMLDRIEVGEADGIIAWDIDRLYRNPVDEGRLRWMLQKGVIRAIRTPHRSFYPEDAGLLMGVEGGRATEYVIRLSKNVKRGLLSKAQNGWRPGPAPIGYKNVGDVGSKTITCDEKRFDIIRKMWDLMLTGTYRPSQIREIANEKWGLRTVKRRSVGGKKLAMSHVYKIFHDPFYYGYFEWTDYETEESELIKGKHKPMITKDEYDRVQILLGEKGKPQPQVREFAYTGIMSCGDCGNQITAELKHQCICASCKNKFSILNTKRCPKCNTEIADMNKPTIVEYTYYRCTKKGDTPCDQKYVRKEELEKQIDQVLASLTIDEDYLDLALEYLREHEELEFEREDKVKDSLRDAYDDIEQHIKQLNQEYTSPLNKGYDLYTPEEFKLEKTRMRKERAKLKQELDASETRVDNTLELSEKTFEFCTYARHHFNNGDLRTKRNILSSLGSNIVLKNKKVRIEPLYPFLLVQKFISEQKEKDQWLEPRSDRSTKGKEEAFTSSIPDWLPG